MPCLATTPSYRTAVPACSMIAALWIASELIHHSLVTVTGTDPLRRACPHAADAHALMFFFCKTPTEGESVTVMERKF